MKAISEYRKQWHDVCAEMHNAEDAESAHGACERALELAADLLERLEAQPRPLAPNGGVYSSDSVVALELAE